MATAVGANTPSEHFQAGITSKEQDSASGAVHKEPVVNKAVCQNPEKESGDEENADSKEKTTPKVKKFDNKNYVEAPIPKTNPWNKSAGPLPKTPPAVVPVKKPAGICLFLIFKINSENR